MQRGLHLHGPGGRRPNDEELAEVRYAHGRTKLDDAPRGLGQIFGMLQLEVEVGQVQRIREEDVLAYCNEGVVPKN